MLLSNKKVQNKQDIPYLLAKHCAETNTSMPNFKFPKTRNISISKFLLVNFFLLLQNAQMQSVGLDFIPNIFIKNCSVFPKPLHFKFNLSSFVITHLWKHNIYHTNI